MCIQPLYLHTCNHYALGQLTLCPVFDHLPNPLLILLDHTTHPIISTPTPCPQCTPLMTRIHPQPLGLYDPRAVSLFEYGIYEPYPNLAMGIAGTGLNSAFLQGLYGQFIPPPLPQPLPQVQVQVAAQPPLYHHIYPRPLQQPQQSPQLSLRIPPNTIREMRRETIGGRVIDVEHFHFGGQSVVDGGTRGYNFFHGLDTGPLPPGWGPVLRSGDDAGLNLAVSGVGAGRGEGGGSGEDGGVEDGQGTMRVVEQHNGSDISGTSMQGRATTSNLQDQNGQEGNAGVVAQAGPVNEQQILDNSDVNTPS